MANLCRQDRHCKLKRNYGIGKEVDGSIEIIFSKKRNGKVRKALGVNRIGSKKSLYGGGCSDEL
jgi:hypothetical protein